MMQLTKLPCDNIDLCFLIQHSVCGYLGYMFLFTSGKLLVWLYQADIPIYQCSKTTVTKFAAVVSVVSALFGKSDILFIITLDC